MNDGPYQVTNQGKDARTRGAHWRVIGPGGTNYEVGDGIFGEQRAKRLVEQLNAAYYEGRKSAWEPA